MRWNGGTSVDKDWTNLDEAPMRRRDWINLDEARFLVLKMRCREYVAALFRGSSSSDKLP